MTVPGVGPVTALAYAATVGDAERFAKSRAVGAYVGLTSRRWQSGEMDYSGRISKHGDAMLRSLLYEAANSLLTVVRRAHPLKCQRRSKSTPLAGVKMHHLMRFSPALAVVPVVHRRDPRCFV